MTSPNNSAAGVWIFYGMEGRFAPGVFTIKEDADTWIMKHRLTGVLTLCPLNCRVYDWAIEKGLFKPKKIHETSPLFIQGFSTASQEHYHYEDGRQA